MAASQWDLRKSVIYFFCFFIKTWINSRVFVVTRSLFGWLSSRLSVRHFLTKLSEKIKFERINRIREPLCRLNREWDYCCFVQVRSLNYYTTQFPLFKIFNLVGPLVWSLPKQERKYPLPARIKKENENRPSQIYPKPLIIEPEAEVGIRPNNTVYLPLLVKPIYISKQLLEDTKIPDQKIKWNTFRVPSGPSKVRLIEESYIITCPLLRWLIVYVKIQSTDMV